MKPLVLTKEEEAMISAFTNSHHEVYRQNFDENLKLLNDVCSKIVKGQAPILNHYEIYPKLADKDFKQESFGEGRYPKRQDTAYSLDEYGQQVK